MGSMYLSGDRDENFFIAQVNATDGRERNSSPVKRFLPVTVVISSKSSPPKVSTWTSRRSSSSPWPPV